jgi:hypothetical protein
MSDAAFVNGYCTLIKSGDDVIRHVHRRPPCRSDLHSVTL